MFNSKQASFCYLLKKNNGLARRGFDDDNENNSEMDDKMIKRLIGFLKFDRSVSQ